MRLKIFLYISLIAISAASLACGSSNATSNQMTEVFLDDEKLAKSDVEEVVFDDRSVQLEDEQVFTAAENSSELPRTLADNSEITVKYDGYGNKTETRSFKNHPRLTTILIRTAANGQKQLYAYGYGKEVKILSAEMSNVVLTSSADEIANAAGLYETRSNEDLTNFRKQSKSLQPLPSSNFPVQMPAPPTATEQIPQYTEPQEAEKPSVVEKSDISGTVNPASNQESSHQQN